MEKYINQERADYLSALGIPAFLYTKPMDVIKSNVQKMRVQCLVVETQNADSFCQSGAVQDFLFKMLSTIKLKKKHIKCIAVDANDLEHTLKQYDAKSVLLMGKDLCANTKSYFHTHHPSEILSNETLKREAWETLKQLQQCLKS